MRDFQDMNPLRGAIASAILLVVAGTAFAQTGGAANQCATAQTLDSAEAQNRAIEKGDPEYPPLARQAGIRGVVRVEVCVSAAGAVIVAKPLDRNPVLVPAAIQSAQKWRFKAGAEPFKTVLEISFSNGKSPVEMADETARVNRFFAEDNKCRAALGAQKADEAVASCTEAVGLADKLPKERTNERTGAYENAGHAYVAQMKFDVALRYYRTELEIALASLPPDAAELAYAYRDVAVACHALGQTAEAGQDYAKAEQTLVAARDHIGLAELKPRYTARLKQIREYYLLLLQQTGQTGPAADLEKRMQSDGK
jgi:TonB family protein